MKYWAVLLAFSAGPATSNAGPQDLSAWHRLVGILQYLESDYPAAIASHSPSEMAEQVQMAKEAEQALADLGPEGAPFAAPIREVRRKVEGGEDPDGVRRLCADIAERLVAAGGLSRSPKRPPDLTQGEKLYATNCAICHGLDGKAQTPLASGLNPKPADFTDPQRMGELSPYQAFNALTFGIQGTSMPSYSLLDEQDRWALAFYLFTLRQPPCTHSPPPESLETLATSTDAALAKGHGEGELACLRRKLPNIDEERLLLLSRGLVEQATSLASEGKFRQARQALLDAYLSGFEPIEPLLRARDPKLVTDIEDGFQKARLAAERESPQLRPQARSLLALLDKARKSRSGPQSFASVFWLSFIILLREGFEAAVVIAALLAVLKKMEATESAKWVHTGWISATVVGAVAFFFFRHLLVGSRRELLEALFSLFAVGMLIYAALWLNARANIRKLMGELRSKIQGAVHRGSAAGLFVIAFTAMLRESLETAVFLEGLAIDSPSGVRWGIALGLLCLLALVLFIRRVGYRLPMKPLFNASTVLLLATAVVLLGQGLHALQEIGAIPARPFPMIRVEALGIYPDLFTFVPQLLLALAPFAVWAISRKRHPGSPGAVPDARAP